MDTSFRMHIWGYLQIMLMLMVYVEQTKNIHLTSMCCDWLDLFLKSYM
jgi:hypothetical protein